MSEVTQQDREAFASVYDEHAPKYASAIRSGEHDATPLMHGFIRTRLQYTVELDALRKGLKNLLDACYQADGLEELSECIDGDLLDEASEALELQYPVIWTDEQVEALSNRQYNKSRHPYTCGGDRSDRAHTFHAEESGEYSGQLYPTNRGWKCPACDYRQFWAHESDLTGTAIQQKEGSQ